MNDVNKNYVILNANHQNVSATKLGDLCRNTKGHPHDLQMVSLCRNKQWITEVLLRATNREVENSHFAMHMGDLFLLQDFRLRSEL